MSVVDANMGLLTILGCPLLLTGAKFVGSAARVDACGHAQVQLQQKPCAHASQSDSQDGKSVVPEASGVVPPRAREATPGNKEESSDPEVLAEKLSAYFGQARSPRHQDTWQHLHGALISVTPAAGETKSQAPSPNVLATVCIARAELDAFVAGLSAAQQDEVKRGCLATEAPEEAAQQTGNSLLKGRKPCHSH